MPGYRANTSCSGLAALPPTCPLRLERARSIKSIAFSLPMLLIAVTPGRLGARPASSSGALPPQCENRLGEEYETRGTASVEKLGDRFVLTVHCDGVHRIYARPS